MRKTAVARVKLHYKSCMEGKKVAAYIAKTKNMSLFVFKFLVKPEIYTLVTLTELRQLSLFKWQKKAIKNRKYDVFLNSPEQKCPNIFFSVKMAERAIC